MLKNQKYWDMWAQYLQQRGLDTAVALLLDCIGPLSMLSAQGIHFGAPFLRRILPNEQLEALANILEDEEETHSFATFLREGIISE
jgi:hypothetical protein